MKHVEKVKVISSFPGFMYGDILTLNKDTGIFYFTYNNEEASTEDAIDMLSNYLNSYKPAISKEDVIKNLGTYFEDVSQYQAMSVDQIKSRIETLKGYIEMYRNKDNLPEELIGDRDTAITVWQNLIWELELVLGMRTL